MYKKNLYFSLIFVLVSTIFAQDFVVEDFKDKTLKGWFVVGDSGSGGASTANMGVVSTDGINCVKFSYSLQKTDKWEWCYATIGKVYDKEVDISVYKGVQFKIKSSQQKEYVNVNLVTTDSNLKINKYDQYVVSISTQWKYIAIPFDKFRIVGWWKARNIGYKNDLELNRFKSIEFSKPGTSGEKGEIYIAEISFYKDKPKGQLPKLTAQPSTQTLTFLDDKKSVASDGVIKIYTDKKFIVPYKNKPAKVPKYFYGTNWGMWLCGFPDKELVKSLNLKVIRSGGNIMSRYNWRTSRYKDTSIGEPYVYQIPSIDEFVNYCREVGAEPLIQINMLGYAPNDKNNDEFEYCMDEKSAAELVRYLNGIKKYNVLMFEMDNEPFIWHFTHKDVVKEPMSVDKYFEKLKKYVIAMREEQQKIDPNTQLIIFAPAICTSWIDWGTYGDTKYYNFESAVDWLIKKCVDFEQDKKENPKGYKLIDVLSFHIYPRFRINWEDPKDFIPQGLPKMLESTKTFWDENYINYYDFNQVRGIPTRVFPRFNEWISKYNPYLQLALTEFNVDSTSRINYPDVLRPLFIADVIGAAAKYGVDYFMQFCLNDYEGGMGMINESDEVNSIYYVFKLFSNNFYGDILETESSLYEVSTYAADDGENYIVMLINKNPAELKIKLNFSPNNKDVLVSAKPYSLYCLKVKKDFSKSVDCVYLAKQHFEEEKF
jgi:hypothetical protein